MAMKNHLILLWVLLAIPGILTGCEPGLFDDLTVEAEEEGDSDMKRSYRAAQESGRELATQVVNKGMTQSLTLFEPLTPDDSGPNSPSLLEFSDSSWAKQYDWTAEAEACGNCHPQAETEWRDSAHFYASFQNPWYRAVVDRFREGIGHEASLFCAGCHDPALIATGSMLREVKADTRHAFAGVSCSMCHRATDARPEGNGALTVSLGEELSIARTDVARHRERMRPETFEDSTLCISCHRGILSPDTGNHHSIVGMDDATEWQRSAWSGNGLARIDSVEQRDCISCHMDRGSSGYMGHRFVGGQTALAHGAGQDEQLRHLTEFLQDDAADLTVAGIRSSQGDWLFVRGLGGSEVVARPIPDGPIFVDVLIENTGVGHRFPGGTLDLQQTWVELTLTGQSGRTLAAIGNPDVPRSMEAAVYRLKAAPVDKTGERMLLHETELFRTLAWNHTLPARDVAVARFEVPSDVAYAAMNGQIRARLLHRRHPEDFYAWVCEKSQSQRAQAFDAAFKALGYAPVDACSEQPTTVLVEETLNVSQPSPDDPSPRLLWRYAEGLSDGLQEELGDALDIIELQRSELVLDEEESARLKLTEGAVRARLGQIDRALTLFDEVEAVFDVPSVDYQRFLAFARVWRWEEAAISAAAVTSALPGAELGWIAKSRAHASLGEDAEALAAATRGLAIQPRSPEMLRTQYTTTRKLFGSDDPRIEVAHRAFRRFRKDEEGREIQARCFRSESCENERIPLSPRTLVLMNPAAASSDTESKREEDAR
jgi:tetratricopeptide (TPR) repeat protein